jgi:alpha-D-ribose 1-methylphosphonate 5-triphosphate synthase subunit PhnH
MNLDKVHDLQAAFRTMIAVHSFPGRILSVRGILDGVDADLSLPPHLCLPAMTLLDAETGFAVASGKSGEQSRLVSQLTYARPLPPAEADFLLAEAGDEFVLAVLEAAKEGTLENPHEGATVIMEVAGMASDDPANAEDARSDGREDVDWPEWVLTGPGIETERRLKVAGSPFWAEARTERNREFPLGVDILLLDASGLIAALPRTTRMMRSGGEAA